MAKLPAMQNQYVEFAKNDGKGKEIDIEAIESAIEDAKEKPVIPTTLSVNILTSANDEITAQKPVVEVMTGYYYTAGSSTVELNYVGTVKNGNKLTIALAGTLNTEETLPASGEYNFGYITIPADIGSKLFPISGNILGFIPIAMVRNLYSAPTNSVGYISKDSATLIKIAISTNTLAVSTSYRFRFEITFLLSENLAPVTP